MKCKVCGHEIKSGEKACPQCGTMLLHMETLKMCPKCGWETMEHYKYCRKCWTELIDNTIRVEKPKAQQPTQARQTEQKKTQMCVFTIENGVLVSYDIHYAKAVIPDGVTEIGSHTFSWCRNLKSVVIPDSVTKIGDYAFDCCSNLAQIILPDSVTEIGSGAFRGCEWLQSVVIPGSVTKIMEGAFAGCKRLISVEIREGVTEIGEGAFRGCEWLQSVVIPGSVKKIGESAFDWCISLKSVEIPDSVTEIEPRAFYGCSDLRIKVSDSVKTVGKDAFFGCLGFDSDALEETQIKVSDDVKTMGENTLKSCAEPTKAPDSDLREKNDAEQILTGDNEQYCAAKKWFLSENKIEELDRWYTYGTRSRFCGDPSARVVFTSRDKKITKTIVDDYGNICNYPGIDKSDEKELLHNLNGKSIKPVINFRTEFTKLSDGNIRMLWTFQPDGRFWEDDDGFGAEKEEEIRLFALLDENGDFTAPFRIYNIGSRVFYG